MKRASGVAGVCALRDARDLVPFLCGHYLRSGFARILFIDDGSTDGTSEFLSALSRREPRISVRRIVNDSYAQAQLLTEGTNELIADGFSIVVPFDADEFWNVGASALERRLAPLQDTAFKGRWVNFVQAGEVERPGPFRMVAIKYRAPALPDAVQATITSFKKPFVCHVDVKVGCKSRHAVAFENGQHNLCRGPTTIDDVHYEIFHIPLRAKSEIIKRGLNYEPRRAALRSGRSSWQSAFHHAVVTGDRVDEVWAANSAHRQGCLESYGERIALTRDRRLGWTLMRAWTYLAARHGMTFPF